MAGARIGVVVDGLRAVLTRLAAAAPVRVFALSGSNAQAIENAMAGLLLEQEIILTDSPCSANILLAAGDFPVTLHEPARRIHDQLCHPRRTIRVRQGARDGADAIFPDAISEYASSDLGEVLRRVHRDLLTGAERSEQAILPDEEPAEWRGVGPYGQGGTGMTGGVPYGRPMAETAPDRDGLTLDQLSVRVGPFFPAFPTGLTLAVKLQGDVIQEVIVDENPFALVRPDSHEDGDEPFIRALAQPVLVSDLEMARARHHLHWLAIALQLHGLHAMALRSLAIARSLSPGAVEPIAKLKKVLSSTRSVLLAGGGVGITPIDRVRDRALGPVARAAGCHEDMRAEIPVYRGLGFETIVQPHGDARSRFWQRLDEAAQSLELAGRAGDATTGGDGRVEGPRGVIARDADPLPELLGLLPELLPGLEWGDAVATVVSLDLDLRGARSHRAS